jgi:glycosyltransferase involved in cell wall biosynthesis
MAQRLKVLISAYACEPHKGSEPEAGWQWALQMARFHEVTVLTRSNNRPAIEAALANLHQRQPVPHFVYHDLHPLLLLLKRRLGGIKTYYLLWQKSARKIVEGLHAVNPYDLMHHVTFAGYRYPIAIWGHGVASIWGPIGGIESIPAPLLPWHHPLSLGYEVLRNFSNVIQATPYYVLPRRAHATTLILASTREMQNTFIKLGFAAELMPTIGLRPADLPYAPRPATKGGPLKLLFVGNIITLKGIDLALEALSQSETTATLALIGDGTYLQPARERTRRLGLEGRVTFLGRLPREQVLNTYGQYDVFLFPSLHDTGGYAVIEAMFNELPVLCLDCGGPAIAVQAGCGFRVPLGSRAKVIAGLAGAIRSYDRDRELVRTQGRAAREVILKQYDWDIKGEQMNARYQEVVARFRDRKATKGGMGEAAAGRSEAAGGESNSASLRAPASGLA